MKLSTSAVLAAASVLTSLSSIGARPTTQGSHGYQNTKRDQIRSSLIRRDHLTNASDPFGWLPCDSTQPDGPFWCGELVVPLDYLNPSDSRNATLAVTMYQAGAEKSDYTLLLNPGGPGVSGTGDVWSIGPVLSLNYTGGMYDVLSWDPRGVNQSKPEVACFPADAYRDRWQLFTHEFYTLGNETDYNLVDAMNEAEWMGCQAMLGDIPSFMGTAYNARDIDEIRKALGNELTDAIGYSYGTAMFQTYTQMFPDKVGRIIIDGIEFEELDRNPLISALNDQANITATFEVGFIGECVAAGPELCPMATEDLYANNATIAEATSNLLTKMYALFDSLKVRPMPGVSPYGPGIVTFRGAIEPLYQGLYHPALWPLYAEVYAELLTGNATSMLTLGAQEFFTFDPAVNTSASSPGPYDWTWPVSQSIELTDTMFCIDAVTSVANLSAISIDDYAVWRQEMNAASYFGGDFRFQFPFRCRHFPYVSAEQWTGNFNNSLNNPILIVSNTYDPATPMINGQSLYNAMGYDNARFLRNNGAYGHCSFADISIELVEVMAAYWMNGTLPSEGVSDFYVDTTPYQANFTGL